MTLTAMQPAPALPKAYGVSAASITKCPTVLQHVVFKQCLALGTTGCDSSEDREGYPRPMNQALGSVTLLTTLARVSLTPTPLQDKLMQSRLMVACAAWTASAVLMAIRHVLMLQKAASCAQPFRCVQPHMSYVIATHSVQH